MTPRRAAAVLPALAASVALLLQLGAPLAAQRLPATVTPEHYELAFVVDIGRKRFDGTETIRVRLSEPTSRVVLNSAELVFNDVRIEGGGRSHPATVTLDPRAERATLEVAEPLPAGTADIHIRYGGVLNDQLRGFYISKANGRDYAVTQFESTDARRAFPSFDEPAYKATFALTLTIDRGDVAISNGRVLSDTPGPGPSQHTVRFSTSAKMSSYLVAMAIGDFECLEGGADGTPIRICMTPGKKHLGAIALDSAEQTLAFFNDYYAIKYPFGKLDMVAVPDFAAGAMENTAAIFYRESLLLADSATASVATRKDIASTIAHEVAHQWFGNLVTMAWWDDLWLNEGFATWMETRPLAAAQPGWNIPVDEARANQAALTLDSLQSTRPIHTPVQTPAEIEGLFDAISYQKGAAVLRMVEHYVGAESFRDGINAYLRTHAYGNATSEDFWKTIAASSGKPVDRILPTFINQPGVPVVEVSALSCAADGQTRATFRQQRFRLAGGPRAGATGWQIPACIKTTTAGSGANCAVIPPDPVTLDVAPGCAPWIFANAGALGYYRTEYAPAMLRALAPDLGQALSAPERLTLAADEWAMVRADRHSAADFLTLAAGYGRESSSGVLADVTERLDVIAEYLTTDDTRGPFAAFIRAMLRPLFGELGLSPGAGESDERRELRAVVVAALGTIGNDPDIVRQARAAVDRVVAADGSRVPIDPTVADTLVQIAAQHGDRTLYDAFVLAASRATSPAEQRRYLFAPAYFRDPAIIERGLQRTFSAEVRSQDTARYLGGFFDNPVARPRAWAFVKENWSRLEPRFRGFSLNTIVNGFASFCDAAARDDIQDFFKTHQVSNRGVLNRAIEQIDNCIALRRKQTKPVSDWLAARR